MKNPFRLTTPKPSPNVVSFAEGFEPSVRRVWETLTAEERIVVMADLAASPSPPQMLTNTGKLQPLCRATLVLVVESALGLTPTQYTAIGERLKARFALARETSKE